MSGGSAEGGVEGGAGGGIEGRAGGRAELRTIAVLCGYCFALLMSYGFARPSIESLYIDAYTSKALPQAWIGVALAAMAVTAVYGRFAARVELTVLFGRVIVLILGVLAVLLWAARAEVPGAVYLLYVWKDLYIVVLVEMFWTVANHHFELKRARWLYGFFCAMGALGGIVANALVGRVAEVAGTESAPLLVFPLLMVCGVLTRLMPATHPAPLLSRPGVRAPTDLLAGLRVIRASGYLGLLLGVIAAVQVVVTLVDYQFNVVVEAAYPDRDVRTGVVGEVYLYIEVVSFALQVGTGAVVRLLGVTGTLLLIPLMLGGAIVAFVAAPAFLSMAVAKVVSKALDYSLFRAAKEMLYLPLSYAEQTQGKAVVDILTYRVAKGATSGLLLVLTIVGAPAMAASVAALVLVVAWVAMTVAIVRRYSRRMAGGA